MSVDQRIREGLLMTSTHLPEPDTQRALRSVTTGARATSRRRRLVLSGIATAAAAALAVVALSVTGDDNAGEPLPADPGPSGVLDPGSPAELVWGYAYVSDPVTFDDMAENLRENGLAEWIDPLREKWGEVDGRIELDFFSSAGELTASIPGTPAVDSNGYFVMSKVLVFQGDAGSQFEGSATAKESGGQRARLTLIKSEGSALGDIPREVVDRALYTTVPFNEILPPAPNEVAPGTYQSDPIRFGRIADSLRRAGHESTVERLRELWGDFEGRVRVTLEIDGDTASLSIPGTAVAFTGRHSSEGSLFRIEEGDGRDDGGWIELARIPYAVGVSEDSLLFYTVWDLGPAAWDDLPAELVAALLDAPSTGFHKTDR